MPVDVSGTVASPAARAATGDRPCCWRGADATHNLTKLPAGAVVYRRRETRERYASQDVRKPPRLPAAGPAAFAFARTRARWART
jgi:hypothetical protein